MSRIKIRELNSAENHDPDKDYVAIAQDNPKATRKLKIGDISSGANVHVGPNPLTNPEDGDMWFDDVNAELYVYVNSIEGWVQGNGAGSFPATAPPAAPDGALPGRIQNIMPGGVNGVSNYIPAGTWLVMLTGWQNHVNGLDEDLQYQHTGRYTVADGQYLYFKALEKGIQWMFSNSTTKPAASAADWTTVTGGQDTWYVQGGSDVTGVVNGWAMEILQPAGSLVLLDLPTVLYAEYNAAINFHPSYVTSKLSIPQGTIKAGVTAGVPSNAKEVQLYGVANRGGSVKSGFLVKHKNHTHYKTLLSEKMSDGAYYPSTNTTWYPLDESGELDWKFEGGTTLDELVLLEIQGYRT